MPLFPYELTSSIGIVPDTKADYSTNATVPTNKKVTAAEFNADSQALKELAYAIHSGSLFGFVRSAIAPTASFGTGSYSSGSIYRDFVWLDSNGNLIQHLRDGSDRLISGSDSSNYPILTGTLFSTSVMTGSNALFTLLNSTQITGSDVISTKLTASFALFTLLNSTQITGSDVISTKLTASFGLVTRLTASTLNVGGFDIDTSAAADGRVLRYNGSRFVAATLTGSGGGGGVLSASYALGASAADSTLLLDSTRGPVTLEERRAIGSASVPGLVLVNSASATNGAQKYSALLELAGQGFATTPSRSSGVRFGLQARPVQGANNPTGDLVLWAATGSDAYTEVASIKVGGPGLYPINYCVPSTGGTFSYTDANNVIRSGMAIYSDPIVFLYASGVPSVGIQSTAMYPPVDLGTTLGDSTHRWSTAYIKTISADVSTLTSSFAGTDSANAVALIIDSTNAITSGKHVSFRNANTEFAHIKKGAAGLQITSAAGEDLYITARVNGDDIRLGTNVISINPAGNVTYNFAATTLTPNSDITNALGATANRWTDVHSIRFTSSGSLNVGTTKLPGLILTTTSASQVNAQQYSPMLELAGQGFATTPSRSDAVRWGIQARPVQGSNNPTGELVLWAATGSDSYAEKISMTSEGISLKSSTPLVDGITAGSLRLLYGTTNGIYMNYYIANAIDFRTNGDTTYQMATAALKPGADLQSTLGTTANRWTDVHSLRFTSSGSLNVGTTKLPGLILTTTSASNIGAQQYSPMLELAGQGFATTPSRSDAARFALQVKPVQGANNPTNDLIISAATGSDAYAEALIIKHNAGTTQLRGGTNPWSVQSNDGTNSINFYNSVITMTGAGMRPDVSNQIMGGGGWAWGEVMSKNFTSDATTALTISSNTITQTQLVHTVGTGLLKTINVVSNFTDSAGTGLCIIIPTGAFTWDATGNIDSGTGLAAVGRPLLFVYSHATTKWYIAG